MNSESRNNDMDQKNQEVEIIKKEEAKKKKLMIEENNLKIHYQLKTVMKQKL